MLVEHRGAVPVVDPSAYVAPTAVLGMERQVAWLGAHREDREVAAPPPSTAAG